MNKKESQRTKIDIDFETRDKLKEMSNELGISLSEIVRESTKYVSENNIDICKNIKERDEVLIKLRPRILKRFGTIAEAARQLETTPATLSRYFSGKHKPSKSMVAKLLKVLD